MTDETPETSGRSGGAWRWPVAAGVLLLLMYPLARLTMDRRGDAPVAQPASAQTALQTSFEQYQAGKYPEAITAAKAALAADPNLADAYNNLAVSYLGLRMFDEGIEAAQQAIRLRPDHQLAKNNLAWIQREKGKAVPAPVTAEASKAAASLLDQSLQDYQAGRFTDCVDKARQSAKLNPNSAQAFNNIGICAGHAQLWDEAIRNTQEALRLSPDMQLARNNLAWIQQEKLKAAGSKAK